MGYWLDLDEQPEERLREELARREALQAKGLCDYCGQSPAMPSCKEGQRHTAPLRRQPSDPIGHFGRHIADEAAG